MFFLVKYYEGSVVFGLWWRLWKTRNEMLFSWSASPNGFGAKHKFSYTPLTYFFLTFLSYNVLRFLLGQETTFLVRFSSSHKLNKCSFWTSQIVNTFEKDPKRRSFWSQETCVKRTRGHPCGHAWRAVTAGSRSSPLTPSTPSVSSQILTHHHICPFFLLVFLLSQDHFCISFNIFLYKFILETKKTVCPKISHQDNHLL